VIACVVIIRKLLTRLSRAWHRPLHKPWAKEPPDHLIGDFAMCNDDALKLETYAIRAAVARAFQMSGCGWARNQVTNFLDSLDGDGFTVARKISADSGAGGSIAQHAPVQNDCGSGGSGS
jgi:hypothetical protein